MNAPKTRQRPAKDAGTSPLLLGDLEAEAFWKLDGQRTQIGSRDLDGNEEWVDGLWSSRKHDVTVEITPQNKDLIESLKKHDRYTPIRFVLGGTEHGLTYLLGVKIDSANRRATFTVSNKFN